MHDVFIKTPDLFEIAKIAKIARTVGTGLAAREIS
jgi:hypothetical protein